MGVSKTRWGCSNHQYTFEIFVNEFSKKWDKILSIPLIDKMTSNFYEDNRNLTFDTPDEKIKCLTT